MAKALEFGDLTPNLFLKNITSLPGILISFDLISLEYVAYENQRHIIAQTKTQFLVFCRKIMNEIIAICSKNSDYHSIFDYEELLASKRIINSLLPLVPSQLLPVTIDKIEDIITFVLTLEKYSSKITLSNSDAMLIRQEIFITRHRLHL